MPLPMLMSGKVEILAASLINQSILLVFKLVNLDVLLFTLRTTHAPMLKIVIFNTWSFTPDCTLHTSITVLERWSFM